MHAIVVHHVRCRVCNLTTAGSNMLSKLSETTIYKLLTHIHFNHQAALSANSKPAVMYWTHILNLAIPAQSRM